MNCLKSIYDSSMSISFEIIIVDNFSEDDSHKTISSLYNQVTWVQSEYNAGFARANNMGIDVASGRNILLLNADTIVQDNALEKTMQLFDNQPNYSACGVQLLNPDLTPQHSGAKFITGGLNILLPLPYFGKFMRSVSFSAGVKQPNVFEVAKDVEVDWIVGAFLMVKKSTIDQCGKLDENFFMYAEEIEWCSRLRKIGPMILFSKPKVIHLGGGSSSLVYKTIKDQSGKILWNKKGFQVTLSNFLRIRKQYGRLWFIFNLCIYIIEIPIFLTCLTLDKLINSSNTNFEFSNLTGYIKNVHILLKHFCKIIQNKDHFYKL